MLNSPSILVILALWNFEMLEEKKRLQQNFLLIPDILSPPSTSPCLAEPLATPHTMEIAASSVTALEHLETLPDRQFAQVSCPQPHCTCPCALLFF